MSRTRWTVSARPFAVWLVVVAGAGGCQQPDARTEWGAPAGKPHGLTCPVISRIVCFFTQPYFLSFDREGDRNPEGFRCTMYLESRETSRGIHADGTLRAKMFRIDRGPDRKAVRNLVQEWEVSTGELPRAKSETALGWGYAPQFFWGEVDVLGKEIELVFYFESPDGRVAQSQTTTLKVPARRD